MYARSPPDRIYKSRVQRAVAAFKSRGALPPDGRIPRGGYGPLGDYASRVQRSVAAFNSRGALPPDGAIPNLGAYASRVQRSVSSFRSRGALPQDGPTMTGSAAIDYVSRVQNSVRGFSSRGALPPDGRIPRGGYGPLGMMVPREQPYPGDELGLNDFAVGDLPTVAGGRGNGEDTGVPFPRRTPQFLPYDDGFVKMRSQQSNTRRDHLSVPRPAGYASDEELADRSDELAVSRYLSGFSSRGFNDSIGTGMDRENFTRSDVRSPTSTRTEVRSPTRTSTEVRSPTRTSTWANTRGNFTSTVTGGAGAGATHVTINIPPGSPVPSGPAGAALGSIELDNARYMGSIELDNQRYMGDMTPGEAAYNRSSAPKSAPTAAENEDLQEIVVSGRAVPWYMWAIGGAAVLFVLKR